MSYGRIARQLSILYLLYNCEPHKIYKTFKSMLLVLLVYLVWLEFDFCDEALIMGHSLLTLKVSLQ